MVIESKMSTNKRELLVKLIPWIFVVIWSTGFIAAKLSIPYMAPFTVLFVRMGLALCLFALIIFWQRRDWGKPADAIRQLIVGLLIHTMFLGGVFTAIDNQFPAGITALLMGLQPILTAVISMVWLGSYLRLSQWVGLTVGLMGVWMVVFGQGIASTDSLPSKGWYAVIIGLTGMSVGTVFQKRFGGSVDPVIGAFFQYLAATISFGALAVWIGDYGVRVTLTLVLSLAWMVIALSVTAILLLMVMIREGEAAAVASYFYLVPPFTALQAWLLFGERMGALGIAGVTVAMIGVYMITRPQRE